jgi:hypothetical protein
LALGRLVLLGFVVVFFELGAFLTGALATFFEEAVLGFFTTSATLLRSVIER